MSFCRSYRRYTANRMAPAPLMISQKMLSSMKVPNRMHSASTKPQVHRKPPVNDKARHSMLCSCTWHVVDEHNLMTRQNKLSKAFK